jgi:protein ImuB
MYACIYIPQIACCSPVFGTQTKERSKASGAKILVGRVDVEAAKRASSLLRGLARLFSPHVEFVDEGTVILPIAPLERLMGGPRMIASEIAKRLSERGLHGHIGIASQPDTAVLTARSIPGMTVIPDGMERRMLGKLPVQSLPLVSEESLRVLDHWGIQTLDEFCALPEAGVLERLGRDGLRLLQLARGELRRPLKPEGQGISYTERVETGEHPLTLLEPLLFLLSRLAHELCGRLRSQSRATTEMRLQLDLEDKTVASRILQLPFPTHDPKTLLKLLQLDLEAHPPAAAICGVQLTVVPVEPRVVQHDLYTPPAPEPEKLELTLGRIRAMVGVENVGSPELLDTHRRDAWRMRASPALEVSSFLPQDDDAFSATADTMGGVSGGVAAMRLAFRYFRPPLKARVELGEGGRPKRVFAQQIYGTVVECAGPWKSSGDWWRPAVEAGGWSREEWDLGLNDGGLYRAFSVERQVQDWYLEGSYD